MDRSTLYWHHRQTQRKNVEFGNQNFYVYSFDERVKFVSTTTNNSDASSEIVTLAALGALAALAAFFLNNK